MGNALARSVPRVESEVRLLLLARKMGSPELSLEEGVCVHFSFFVIVYDVGSTLRNHFCRVCENCTIHFAPNLLSHFLDRREYEKIKTKLLHFRIELLLTEYQEADARNLSISAGRFFDETLGICRLDPLRNPWLQSSNRSIPRADGEPCSSKKMSVPPTMKKTPFRTMPTPGSIQIRSTSRTPV